MVTGNVSRREFLHAVGIGAAGVLWRPSGLSAQTGGQSKYNVLFIAVDDLRPQLGCYGHELIHSPNIDQLAKEGLLFERTYCQQAVCAPSRASIMSGTRPDTTKIYNLSTPLRQAMPEVLTLPEHFKNNGYTSISIGKIYHHTKDDLQGWSKVPYRSVGAWKGRGYLTEKAQNEMKQLARQQKETKGRGPAYEAADVAEDEYPGWCEGTDLNYSGRVDFVDFGIFARSWLWEKIGADIDMDGDVDLVDYAMFAAHWLESDCGACGGAELSGDGDVGLDDLLAFTTIWLAGVE